MRNPAVLVAKQDSVRVRFRRRCCFPIVVLAIVLLSGACSETLVNLNDASTHCPSAVGEWGIRSCTPVLLRLGLTGFEPLPTAVIFVSIWDVDGQERRSLDLRTVDRPGEYLFPIPHPGYLGTSGNDTGEFASIRIVANWYDAPSNQSQVAIDSVDQVVRRVLPGQPLNPDTIQIELARSPAVGTGNQGEL